MIRKIVTVLALSVALVGCGGDGDGDGDDSDASGDGGGYGVPECSDVWKVGETIDLNTYEGCHDGGTIEIGITQGCYDAKNKYRGQFATYKDELWVVQTGTDPKTGQGGKPGKVTDVDPKC